MPYFAENKFVFSRSTWLHLRIPFALYLMPVFFFAAAQNQLDTGTTVSLALQPWRVLLSFVIIHLFLYPAVNGYNSWFDKDEGSIGGLEHPPKVQKELYYVSLGFDVLAIASGFLLGWMFALMLFIFGIVSKMYSHPSVRLKKYPVTSLLVTSSFQGGLTYIMSLQAMHNLPFIQLLSPAVLYPALLCTLLLIVFYPMTQVYQHEEDAARGDRTISRMLGIKGTFIFCGLMFLLSDLGFYFFFRHYPLTLTFNGSFYGIPVFWLFQLFLMPVLMYFIRWSLRVWKDQSRADFHSTMGLNRIASLCMIGFFLLYGILLRWH